MHVCVCMEHSHCFSVLLVSSCFQEVPVRIPRPSSAKGARRRHRDGKTSNRMCSEHGSSILLMTPQAKRTLTLHFGESKI